MNSTSKQFEYKDIDEEGHETLEIIARANHFNKWMYDTIRPFCKGKVFEVGSGLGNISDFFIKAGTPVLLSDIRNSYCDILKKKYGHLTNVIGIKNVDLVDPDFNTKYAEHIAQYDTLFALNVVEHIEDDSLAITNAAKFLVKGGNLIILVPAYQWLYNNFDQELYHFRRYNKAGLEQLFRACDLKATRSFYFNALGMAGWFFSGKLMKKKIIPGSQIRFYNLVIPLAKLIDTLLF